MRATPWCGREVYLEAQGHNLFLDFVDLIESLPLWVFKDRGLAVSNSKRLRHPWTFLVCEMDCLCEAGEGLHHARCVHTKTKNKIGEISPAW